MRLFRREPNTTKPDAGDALELMSDEDRAWRLKHDAEQNQASTPPEDEHVRLQSIWVAECFPPRFADSLVASIQRLGWDDPGRALAYGQVPLAQWIGHCRSLPRGGSTHNLQLIVRPQDKRRWLGADKHEANLPSSVDYATGSLLHVLPGLLVLVFQFVLTDTPSQSVNDALRQDYRTLVEPFGDGGRRYIDPYQQKREAVDAARRRARQQCIDWVRGAFPGAFASTSNPASYPVCEVLTFDLELSANRSLPHEMYGYAGIFDLHRRFDSFRSKDFPGFQLQLPDSWSGDDYTLLLLGNYFEAFGDDFGLQAYGGRGNHGIVNRLTHQFDGTLSRWALHALLRIYEHDYASIREKVAVVDSQENLAGATVAIASLESALLRVSGDVLAVASELVGFCDNEDSFQWNVAKFERFPPLMRPVREPRYSPRALWSKLRKRQVPTLRPFPEPHLFEYYRRDIARRSSRLRQTEEQVRQLIQVGSAVVNARSQQRLAASNLLLQRVVLFLAFITAIIGAGQLYFAWSASHATRASPTVVPLPTAPVTPTPLLTPSSRSRHVLPYLVGEREPAVTWGLLSSSNSNRGWPRKYHPHGPIPPGEIAMPAPAARENSR